jgi:chromosome segregation ATPase
VSWSGREVRDGQGGPWHGIIDLSGVEFMIESIMYVAIGFLVASLLALALISAVHHRAVRLTQRRLADSIPVSLTEIQADRDKLRARFAMQTRRLEVTVEQLEAKVTNQLGDIARKSEAIARLKTQLAEKHAASDALSARLRNFHNENQDIEHGTSAEPTVADANANAQAVAQAISAKDTELAKAALEASELTFANETQRVEIVMLKTQMEQFKARIEQLEREAGEAKQRLFNEQVTVSNMTRALEEKREADDAWRTERTENEFLRERIADIAAQVAHLSMNEAGAPIVTILKDAAASVRPAGHDRAANGGDPGVTNLVDRIRKLQTATSSAS